MDPQIILAFTLLASTIALGYISTSSINARNRRSVRRHSFGGTRKKN